MSLVWIPSSLHAHTGLGFYLTIVHNHEMFAIFLRIRTISLTASLPILATIPMNEMRSADEFRAQLKYIFCKRYCTFTTLLILHIHITSHSPVLNFTTFFGDPHIATKIWERYYCQLYFGIYFRSFSRLDV